MCPGERLSLMTVGGLIFIALGSMASAVWLAGLGKPPPAGLDNVIPTIVGALAGFLTHRALSPTVNTRSVETVNVEQPAPKDEDAG